MMKVARIHGPTDIRVSQEPKPKLQLGESMVRVTAVGLCGSDLHWFHSAGIGDATLSAPLVLGHEFAGVVEGGELDGKTVAVDPAIPCLDCIDCHQGNRNLCVNVRFAGHGTNDGGLRQYVAWPTKFLYPLPDSMDGIDGALLEPLGVALHGWDLGKVKIGSRVLVVGAGPIGLCLIKLAKASGAQVIAVEPLAHRREAALAAGADYVYGSQPVELETVADLGPIDYAFEAANLNAGAQIAIDLIKPGGTVVLVGIPEEDTTIFTAATARRKGLTIKVSRRMGEVYPRAIALVERGVIKLRSLATHIFEIDESGAAFESANIRDGLKVLIRPN